MGSALSALTNIATGGMSGALLDKPSDPTSPEELEAVAKQKAEKKRLALAAARSEKGKTVFSQPVMPGGVQLKTQLGM